MACSGGSAGPCVLYPVRPRVAAGARRIGSACASRLRATASLSPSGYLREFSAGMHGRIEGRGWGSLAGCLQCSAVQCRGSTSGPSHPVRAGRPTGAALERSGAPGRVSRAQPPLTVGAVARRRPRPDERLGWPLRSKSAFLARAPSAGCWMAFSSHPWFPGLRKHASLGVTSTSVSWRGRRHLVSENQGHRRGEPETSRDGVPWLSVRPP